MRYKDDRRALTIAAVIALALGLATWFAFAKDLPFQEHFEVRGVFAGINQLEKGDDVRASGLRVGKVEGIGRGPRGTSIVTLRLDDDVVLHRDATMAIRPRLVLEGNDQVALTLGSPSAPVLRSGATIPLARTSHAVQLDQVLGALTRPTRDAFKGMIANLAQGLGPAPRDRREPSGAEGLRGAARELDRTLADAATVARAARGTRTGDLGRAVRSTGELSAQLAEDPAALADAVTNLRRFSGALAAQDAELAASVRRFDELMRSAPADLARIDTALPPLTRFARSLQPALRAAPRELRAVGDLLGQLRGISTRRELPLLVRRLAPVTASLPSLERGLTRLFPLVESVSSCVTRNVLPTLNTVVEDGPNTSHRPIWQDMVHLGAGLAGAASDFDGNGTTIRLGITESDQTLSGLIPGFGRITGVGPEAAGIRPVWLGYGVDPPYRPDAPCLEQDPPDLSKRSGGPARTVRADGRRSLSASGRRMIAALLGGADDRRRLLRTLLADLGLGAANKRRRAPSSGARRPARPLRPRLPDRPKSAAPPSVPAPPQLPVDVPNVVDDVVGAVGKLLPKVGR